MRQSKIGDPVLTMLCQTKVWIPCEKEVIKMTQPQLREMILKELPMLIQSDTAFREAVLDISRGQFANRVQTGERFDHVMARLDRSMEKWDENHKALIKLTATVEKLSTRLDQKIEEDRQKWEEHHQEHLEMMKSFQSMEKRLSQVEKRLDQKIEEDRQKWAENQRQWAEKRDEDRQKWAENQKRWEENQRQWAEKREEDRQKWKEQQQLWANNQKALRKLDTRIMAMGARWGRDSEDSFRNGLAAILRDFPGVQVLHVDERDEEGIVHGHPAQVELDLIIKNGVLMIGELKSGVSQGDVSTFQRKIHFYEQKHNRQATRKLIISPMVDDRALVLAKVFGIEVYSFAEDVDLSLNS